MRYLRKNHNNNPHTPKLTNAIGHWFAVPICENSSIVCWLQKKDKVTTVALFIKCATTDGRIDPDQ